MLRVNLFLTLFLLLKVSSLKVVTTSYGKLRGITEWSDDKNHKYIFKSIPFAKPPLGNLRFALPQHPEPWNDILDASKYSHACLSNVTNTRYPQKYISEDCLYINIFTSQKCLSSKCSVIIYYHGGGFKVDSATMFPDKFILDRYVAEDVVFAIPAYRLGVFGQLYFGPNDFLSENVLLFDVVHALKYVHNEIEHFGGDSKRVTIMGHSAGGTIVDVLGFSDLIDPDKLLFQQMIVLSAPGEFGFNDLVVENSFVLAERLGCISKNQTARNSSDISKVLSCLRKLDSHEILRIQTEMIKENDMNFKSIIRGAPFMKLGGKISNFKRNTSPRNIIYGATELEFQFDSKKGPSITGTFLDLENPVSTLNHYYDLYPFHGGYMDHESAGVFISARTYCEAMVNAGADAYLFETRQKPWSIHVTDMQYFIGIHREYVHTTDMDILDSFYSKMLVNFTKTSPEWQKLDPKRMNYLEMKVDTKFGEGPKMMEGYHDKEMHIWFETMLEYDKNLTKAREAAYQTTDSAKSSSQTTKKHSHPTAVPATIIYTTFNKSTTKSQNSTAQNPPLELRNGKSIIEQWWVYIIIVLVIMILVLLVMSHSKSEKEEEIPLLW